MAAGIETRHARACASRDGAGCDCTPTYQAHVFDVRNGRRIRKTFKNRSEAKTWRQDTVVAVRRGEIPATTTLLTVGAAIEAWIDAAKAGTVRTRGRNPFAPGTIRSVEQNHRLRIGPQFGSRRLDRVTLLDLQEWVDELDADGLHPSTIETSVLPLRLAYRRAKSRGEVTIDPTDGLELPQKAQHGTARKPPDPKQIRGLLDAIPEADRATWATFMLCGVRRGELLALRWQDINLKAGTLRVERSYDPASGLRPPKSRSGVRTVPVGPTLAELLRAHLLRCGRRDGLVFGDTVDRPMDPSKFQRRADSAWTAAGHERVTPHVCRHLYASMMAAAGVSLHALSRFMGHSSIAVTFDRYGHLFPGEEAQASTLQEVFLAERTVAHAVAHLP